MTKDIYAPFQGETVQIGQQTNTFSISLSDDVLASINMSRVSITSRAISYDVNVFTVFALR